VARFLAFHPRRETAGILGLTLAIMAWMDLHPVAAAFEWDPLTPQSLILGDSAVRWPVAGSGPGFCADALLARPFSWPGVMANGLRVATAHDAFGLGSSWSLLQAPAYRESRLAIGISHGGERQRPGLVVNFLHVAAGDAVRRAEGGAALDLVWDLHLSPLDVGARVSGVLESRGARHLGEPREWKLRACVHLAPLDAEFRIEEGSRGRRAGMGVILRPWPPLAVGVGWSATEMPLRLFVEVRRQWVAIGWGTAFHTELPPTPVVALSLLPSRVEGDGSPGAGETNVVEGYR
jgi:hypothetical protein